MPSVDTNHTFIVDNKGNNRRPLADNKSNSSMTFFILPKQGVTSLSMPGVFSVNDRHLLPLRSATEIAQTLAPGPADHFADDIVLPVAFSEWVQIVRGQPATDVNVNLGALRFTSNGITLLKDRVFESAVKQKDKGNGSAQTHKVTTLEGFDETDQSRHAVQSLSVLSVEDLPVSQLRAWANALCSAFETLAWDDKGVCVMGVSKIGCALAKNDPGFVKERIVPLLIKLLEHQYKFETLVDVMHYEDAKMAVASLFVELGSLFVDTEPEYFYETFLKRFVKRWDTTIYFRELVKQDGRPFVRALVRYACEARNSEAKTTDRFFYWNEGIHTAHSFLWEIAPALAKTDPQLIVDVLLPEVISDFRFADETQRKSLFMVALQMGSQKVPSVWEKLLPGLRDECLSGKTGWYEAIQCLVELASRDAHVRAWVIEEYFNHPDPDNRLKRVLDVLGKSDVAALNEIGARLLTQAIPNDFSAQMRHVQYLMLFCSMAASHKTASVREMIENAFIAKIVEKLCACLVTPVTDEEMKQCENVLRTLLISP